MTHPAFTPLSTLTEYQLDSRISMVRDVLRADDEGLYMGGLDLNPPYQRESVWTDEQRQNLIKSSLQGIPIGCVFLNDRGDYVRRVVDGKQRLETFRDWFAGTLTVPMEWFNQAVILDHCKDDEVCSYNSLELRGQRFFTNSASIATYWTKLKTVEEEADLFERINYGGTAHLVKA